MDTVTGQLHLDEHVAMVVDFMQKNLPADRLEHTAIRMPAIAKVLWSDERCAILNRGSLSAATESFPAAACAGGDSVAVADAALPK